MPFNQTERTCRSRVSAIIFSVTKKLAIVASERVRNVHFNFNTFITADHNILRRSWWVESEIKVFAWRLIPDSRTVILWLSVTPWGLSSCMISSCAQFQVSTSNHTFAGVEGAMWRHRIWQISHRISNTTDDNRPETTPEARRDAESEWHSKGVTV